MKWKSDVGIMSIDDFINSIRLTGCKAEQNEIVDLGDLYSAQQTKNE